MSALRYMWCAVFVPASAVDEKASTSTTLTKQIRAKYKLAKLLISSLHPLISSHWGMMFISCRCQMCFLCHIYYDFSEFVH